MTDNLKAFVAKPLPGLPWLVLLAAIWGPVVYLLGAQWSVYQEYEYGWAVPVLCLYLAIRRFDSLPPVTLPRHKITALVLLVAAGLVYWLMRGLQEADPIWRLASYGLALSAVAMTLWTVYLTRGRRRAWHFAFPVAFFLVAVPWPTPVEGFVIQNLTRLNAGLVTEVLNLAGVPALLHGNVIEVSTGLVGIDEACSGIRSFQATLMIALFFGEFYRLPAMRRWGLVLAGPALALAFNFARTLVLVSVAAHDGLPTMQRWHDPTGVALLVGCFFSLWAVAVWLTRLAKMGVADDGSQKSEIRNQNPTSDLRPPPSGFRVSTVALALLIWSVVVAWSTEAWFRCHERHGNQEQSWSARWPDENFTLQTNDIPKTALAELLCDEHKSASWTDNHGFFWQAFWLRWVPADSFYGRTKVALSKSHNPAICLRAAGMILASQLDPVALPVRPGFNLMFDRFVFDAGGHPLYVFFSQTEDMVGNGAANLRMTHWDRLRAALAGSRNYGQVNFEVALAGPASPEEALNVFRTRLPDLITTTRPIK